ncbi:hypothetical protein HUE58_05525 [Candidatus Ruthia endofausta]|uniref:Uncharacterized protein n=1 Tax=Candidatus Ruthia endofausta TaxID=2738852 RepID=A0A6N0HQG0_9GAMM|nr:hypothetical protein [Candidatus Ruthia endofausta]QKQ24563.1 hypothetical protein HUE58_05525 [Candidatus Ruthia endofausta]
MLISATPLNNCPDALYNQILLFKDGNNSTLDFPLSQFFHQGKRKNIKKYYNSPIIKKPKSKQQNFMKKLEKM